jgi:membrane AbrB-like protein
MTEPEPNASRARRPGSAAGDLLRMLVTLGGAMLAARACERLHVPLPWMIGPLVITAAAGVAGLPVRASTRLRHAGQWAIGTVLGLYFTPPVFAATVSLGPVLAVGALWALVLGDAFARWLRWAMRHGAPLHPATAYFGAAIGGASEMAVLAERHGGAVDAVAAAHSLRVLLVVVIVPFALKAVGVHGAELAPPPGGGFDAMGLLALAGLTVAAALAMHRFGLPNPWVLGALAATMALTATGIHLSTLPKAMANAGQLFIGVALGARFTPAFLRRSPRWLAAVASGTVAMIAVSALFAWALANAAGLRPADVVLGNSPGGIAEMAITAAVLHLGVPTVTAFHLLRYVVVLTCTAPIYRWRFAREP